MPLDRFHLPAVFRAAAELGEAAAQYRPEVHPEILAAQAAGPDTAEQPSDESQFRWHDALDAIRDDANRLKRALGATGELRPGRVRADNTPAAWGHFDSRFQDLDYSRPVRIGLRRLALAAIDLSGYAELKQPPPEWRGPALAQLARGIMQVWPALTAADRGEVQHLLPTFQQVFGWPADGTGAPPAWTGPVEIAPEEEYRTIDTSGYYARWKDYLRDLHQFVTELTATAVAARQTRPEQVPAPPPRVEQAQVSPVPREVKQKASTQRGEARVKLIAALTKHHRYADSHLNTEPINNNELARQAKVDKATASAFFKKQLGGHDKYKILCRDTARLAASLKHLNGEYTPDTLFGGNLPGERSSEGDE